MGKQPTQLGLVDHSSGFEGTSPTKMQMVKRWPWRSNFDTEMATNHSLISERMSSVERSMYVFESRALRMVLFWGMIVAGP